MEYQAMNRKYEFLNAAGGNPPFGTMNHPGDRGKLQHRDARGAN